jgi:hypothetical protein
VGFGQHPCAGVRPPDHVLYRAFDHSIQVQVWRAGAIAAADFVHVYRAAQNSISGYRARGGSLRGRRK